MIWGRRPRGSAPPAPTRAPAEAQRIVVLEEGATPSGDYILLPWVARLGPTVVRLDARLPPAAGSLQPGDYVVVLRYLHAPWKAVIERQRATLAGLAWFLDDDLLDRSAMAGLAKGYLRKIETLALNHRAWFERMGCAWWFSTEALGRKYHALSPEVLPLAPPAALCQPRPVVKVAYHGTASHAAELAWLRSVMADVLARHPHIHFELFGDLAVNRLYRDLPRVSVLHPMRWESYLAHTATHRADIGLAPLLPEPFNAGRGAVKFFDYTRMGALGLYARVPPYQHFVRDGVDGVLLGPEPAEWVKAVLAWADDPEGRARMHAAAAARVFAAGG